MCTIFFLSAKSPLRELSQYYEFLLFDIIISLFFELKLFNASRTHSKNKQLSLRDIPIPFVNHQPIKTTITPCDDILMTIFWETNSSLGKPFSSTALWLILFQKTTITKVTKMDLPITFYSFAVQKYLSTNSSSSFLFSAMKKNTNQKHVH